MGAATAVAAAAAADSAALEAAPVGTMTNHGKPATVADILLSDIKVGNSRRRFRDVAGLAESIAEVGLLNPLVIAEDGTLIAGLRRLEAVRSLGWTSVPVSIVRLSELDTQIAEIDENLIRGNLSHAEEARLAADRKRLYQEKHPETRNGAVGRGRNSFADSRKPIAAPTFAEDTAAKTGKSARSVYELTQIGESVAPDVLETVIEHAPEIANSKAQLLELARMDEEKQREVAEKIEAGEAVDLAAAKRAIAEQRREEKRQANRKLVAETPPVESAIAGATYAAIVADPPWTYEHDYHDRAEPLYAQMSEEEIQGLPVADLAADNSVLWLWTTQTHHGTALRLLDAWGFTFRSELVWAKPRFGMGGWLRSQHETCLLATKGKPERLRADVGTVLHAPLGAHSEKPELFYELVETLTSGPWVELFARKRRPGWAYWGAEV